MLHQESIRGKSFHQRKGKLSSHSQILWTEANFTEMYPLHPAIETTPIYIMNDVEHEGKVIRVPMPKGIQKKNIKYLLHRAIYFSLLEMKDHNPLLTTAEVVGFTNLDDDINFDYEMEVGIGCLCKRTSFVALPYKMDASVEKYIPYCTLDRGEVSSMYLVRSLYNGHFLQLHHLYSKNIEYLQKVKETHMQIQHPFVNALVQAFATDEGGYFLYNYIPLNFAQIIRRPYEKFSQSQLYVYTVELIYGMFYLWQQKLLWNQINLSHVGIGEDGHVVLSEEVLVFPPNMQTPSELMKKHFVFLHQFMVTLLFSSEYEGDEAVLMSDDLEDFLHFLKQQHGYEGWKELISHPWVKSFTSEIVLSKGLKVPRDFDHIPIPEKQDNLTISAKSYEQSFTYQNLPYLPTQLNSIFSKYGRNDSTSSTFSTLRGKPNKSCKKSPPKQKSMISFMKKQFPSNLYKTKFLF